MSEPICTVREVPIPEFPPTGPSPFSKYMLPPLAAGGAIPPFFYGFIRKSALQRSLPVPALSLARVAIEGIKASPTVAALVGTQLIVQKEVEARLSRSPVENNLRNMIASSAIVATASVPLLAIFNGQTVGMSPLQSLRAISPLQAGAINLKELTFLFSVRVSGPLSDMMKKVAGDNRATTVGSHFLAGAIGSYVGHPGDTILTWSQNNMSVRNELKNCGVRSLMRGAHSKAAAVGGFTVLYNLIKERLS